MLRNIFLKLHQKGISWVFWRLSQEIRNPSNLRLRRGIDGFLSLRRRFSHLLFPPRANSHLYAIYDLDVNAITYNLIEFLIDSELESKRRGKLGFVVVFVPYSYDARRSWQEYDSVIDSENKAWRFQNILLPLTALSEHCKGVNVLPSRSSAPEFAKSHEVYPTEYDGLNLRSIDTVRLWTELDRANMFDGLRATRQGLRYISTWQSESEATGPVVTITIRNHAFDRARNSDIPEWVKFAHYLRSAGYHPVIIPDTDTAFSKLSPFEGLCEFKECAWNVMLRTALYESAFLNLFVPNGCASLCFFNPRSRYICMNMLPAGSIVTTEESYKKHGLEIGASWKFAAAGQRLSFRPDTFENILAEFEDFVDEFGSGMQHLD